VRNARPQAGPLLAGNFCSLNRRRRNLSVPLRASPRIPRRPAHRPKVKSEAPAVKTEAGVVTILHRCAFGMFGSSPSLGVAAAWTPDVGWASRTQVWGREPPPKNFWVPFQRPFVKDQPGNLAGNGDALQRPSPLQSFPAPALTPEEKISFLFLFFFYFSSLFVSPNGGSRT